MIVDPSKVVTAGQLLLCPLTVADAAEMVEVLADPTLYAFTGGEPPTLAELEQRYARQVAGQAARVRSGATGSSAAPSIDEPWDSSKRRSPATRRTSPG